MELRGLEFANFAANSLLSKELQQHGWRVKEVTSEVSDKDFGDGAVAYFDCGQVVFEYQRKNPIGFHDEDAFEGDTLNLYQSRFSDSWRIQGRQVHLMQLADRDKLNDPQFVYSLVRQICSSHPSSE